MDEIKLRMQLQIIRVTYRAEAGRLPPDALQALRVRAFEILDRVEREVAGDPRLVGEIAAVREEIDSVETG